MTFCNQYKQLNYPSLSPVINYLSQYTATPNQSSKPKKVSSQINQIIYIFGENFRDYSTVKFDKYVCESIYNGSSELGFYIPTNITNPGVYNVQVYNLNIGSNIEQVTVEIN